MPLPHLAWRSFATGIALIGSLVAASQAQAPAAAAESNDPTALRAEIERLKSIMPGQSLAMTQVAYNFNNLWFAARAGNWPLAQFYFGDAKGRLGDVSKPLIGVYLDRHCCLLPPARLSFSSCILQRCYITS